MSCRQKMPLGLLHIVNKKYHDIDVHMTWHLFTV